MDSILFFYKYKGDRAESVVKALYMINPSTARLITRHSAVHLTCITARDGRHNPVHIAKCH